MKLSTYVYRGNRFFGAEKNGGLVNLIPATGVRDLKEFIENHEELMPLAKSWLANDPRIQSFDQVQIVIPLRPSVVLCSGLNYKSHIKENPSAKFLEDPRFFAKLPPAIIGPGEPIPHPGEKFQVDWEVELAVVFGKHAYRLSQAAAMEYVFGYTILHDISSRYIQFKDANETMGKNFAGFCPIGPCIVTSDEIPNPDKLRLSLKVNGVTKQQGTNEEWCFSLPRLIEWATMSMPFAPGDLMSTGTPAGIGYFRDPKEFLRPGDICELEIPEIGKLINPVVAAEYKNSTHAF